LTENLVFDSAKYSVNSHKKWMIHPIKMAIWRPRFKHSEIMRHLVNELLTGVDELELIEE